MSVKHMPKFIAFEGIDGSGKSSNIEVAKRVLEDLDEEVITIREPGNTVLGKQIRELILGSQAPLTSQQEAALFMVARRQSLTEIIEPALAAGKWVICDRYRDSTLAYQAAPGTNEMAHLLELEDILDVRHRPGAVFYFDVEVDTARSRLDHSKLDYIERKGKAFFDGVSKNYLEQIEFGKYTPTQYYMVDANKSLGSVNMDVVQFILRYHAHYRKTNER